MAKTQEPKKFSAEDYRRMAARIDLPARDNETALAVCTWQPDDYDEEIGEYVPVTAGQEVKAMLLKAAESEDRIAERDKVIGLLAGCLKKTADGHCLNGDRLSCPPCIKDHDCKGFAAVQLLRKVSDWQCGFAVNWDEEKAN